MKLTPQIKVALIIAGAAILVLGLAAATLYPQYNKAKAADAEKEELQTNLVTARTLLAYRTQLQKNSLVLKRSIAIQKEEVPDSAELTSILREIQNMAYENNHWMTSIKNTDPVITEGVKYNSWDIEITLEGNWLDTVSFLRDLRDMKRQVRVNKVTFDRATDLRGGDQIAKRVVKHWDPEAYPVRTAISATVYYIPPQPEKMTTNQTAKPEAATQPATDEGGAQ